MNFLVCKMVWRTISELGYMIVKMIMKEAYVQFMDCSEDFVSESTFKISY